MLTAILQRAMTSPSARHTPLAIYCNASVLCMTQVHAKRDQTASAQRARGVEVDDWHKVGPHLPSSARLAKACALLVPAAWVHMVPWDVFWCCP
jgi:hypothetical protein